MSDTSTLTDIEILTFLDTDLEETSPCELTEHSLRCAGDEPASWFAIGGCPHCKREYNLLVCEPGRKRKITAPVTGCGHCGGTFHWPSAITMIPMEW